ncbi:MAG: hypothetical protein HY549_13030 [Elusimicrobia bacterium]|nr:hypothetical protein [Elusimicrobiota bacterium]
MTMRKMLIVGVLALTGVGGAAAAPLCPEAAGGDKALLVHPAPSSLQACFQAAYERAYNSYSLALGYLSQRTSKGTSLFNRSPFELRARIFRFYSRGASWDETHAELWRELQQRFPFLLQARFDSNELVRHAVPDPEEAERQFRLVRADFNRRMADLAKLLDSQEPERLDFFYLKGLIPEALGLQVVYPSGSPVIDGEPFLEPEAGRALSSAMGRYPQTH